MDAPSRLPLLNNPYYRDVLGEYGAFFAIANRVDRVHKSAWIGFQSWRAAARKVFIFINCIYIKHWQLQRRKLLIEPVLINKV